MPAKRTIHISRGDQYGHLTALEDRAAGVASILWRCVCGAEVTALVKNVARGRTRSCGCIRTGAGNPNWNGGAKDHPLYPTWLGMKERCSNPNHRRWASYGGRGITVCDRWSEDFWSFVADVGDRPEGMTLDRIDNDRGYEPGNVRWATPSQQAQNRRPSAYAGITNDSTTGRFVAVTDTREAS